MRMAARQPNPALRVGLQKFITDVGVGDEDAMEVGEEPGGSSPGTTFGERKRRVRMAPVAEHGPQVRRGGFSLAGKEHLDRRLIGLHHRREQGQAPHPIGQRGQRLGQADHPAALRSAIDHQAAAGENLLPPVIGLMVREVAHGQIGQQGRTGKAIEDAWGARRRHHLCLRGVFVVDGPGFDEFFHHQQPRRLPLDPLVRRQLHFRFSDN
jgi:hypothetical protein